MVALLAEWTPGQRLIVRWPWRSEIWPAGGQYAQQALIEGLQRLRPLLRRNRLAVDLEVLPALRSQAQPVVPRWVNLHPLHYADIWVRDSLPLYLRRGARIQAVAAQFNGWGGLDPEFQADLSARRRVREQWQKQGGSIHSLPWVIEGGSLHTNGLGLVIYSRRVWLDPARNPLLNAAQAEHILRSALGARQTIALNNALSSDETGGHADNLLTFLDPQTLLVARADDSSHPDYEMTQALFSSLQYTLGHTYTLIPMPLPQCALSHSEAAQIKATSTSWPRRAGMPLCASYCNGVRFADVYGLPQFNHAADAEALARIDHWNQQQSIHRRIQIVPLPARDLLPGGGGWHCASHIVPRH